MKLGQELAAAATGAREACGLLVGRAGFAGTRLAVWAANVELPNRSLGGDAFELDPGAWVAADGTVRRCGFSVLGFWHTHHGAAVPSERDTLAAWPGSLHAIASRSGAVRVYRRI